jgi:phosphate transport system substrate-binding protein
VTVKHIALAAILLLGFVSCARKGEEETTTKGHLHLLLAESVAPALVPQVDEFMSLYRERGADVSYSIAKAQEANRRFVVDTARMIVTTIPLTEKEKDIVNKTTDQLLEIVLAYEGVVAIVAEKNRVDELSLEQVRGILNGSLKSWGTLRQSGAPQGNIRLVLEDSSDVVDYLSHRILRGDGIRATPQWVHDPTATITSVAKDRLALGFVPACWVDSVRAGVKILALAADSALADSAFKPPVESINKYYVPHPAYLYLNYYPMKRAVYLYARTTSGDFATGFASFVASAPGQKIFLQKGMLPGTQKIVLKPSE